MSAIDAGAALPRQKIDLAPALLPFAIALIAAPFIGSTSTFVTLTVASLAMGFMLFTMASGLTLVFGLMDVLNFGHGAFISVGAYVATLVFAPLIFWSQADSLVLNLGVIFLAALAAAAVCGALGLLFEKVLIQPVYGQHLKQILVTTGGLIVAEQLLAALFGPDAIPLSLPAGLRGSFLVGGAAIEKFRLLAVVIGAVVLAALTVTLNYTKLGLLIRAGVENREMVEALGYRINRLFVGVFMAGSALAGLGGVLWALYREQVTASMGGDLMVLVFIVVIVGGLGSVGGCFLGATLVALIANYAGFLAPKFALVSNIALMVVVLLWRPRGLYPVSGP
jgi:branched-chain amino acid transport system permease protein